MDNIVINYWAVLVAAISNMILGSIWYSPKGLFGKKWMELAGVKEGSDPGGAGKAMSLMFIGALLMAYVVAHFIFLLEIDSLWDAVPFVFWAWLGFIAVTNAQSFIFQGSDRKPWSLFWINSSYNLVALLVMSAILAVWR